MFRPDCTPCFLQSVSQLHHKKLSRGTTSHSCCSRISELTCSVQLATPWSEQVTQLIEPDSPVLYYAVPYKCIYMFVYSSDLAYTDCFSWKD